jgi:hypothetical protein
MGMHMLARRYSNARLLGLGGRRLNAVSHTTLIGLIFRKCISYIEHD